MQLPSHQKQIYTKSDHALLLESFDQDAIWAVIELKRHGHQAYIVGGSIRDLLLGKQPKDFDISTSATPEEIKKIFNRRCLIIGRRFRLAHLRFNDNKIIETSTFRSGDTQEAELITRDNEWGTEEEDVFRRDFTMNALYYDPEEEIIVDYVNGVEDIKNRIVRTIGDPIVRFRQDPVRMLRLLKFLSRFELIAEPTTIKALDHCRDEIMKSAPARVFEEVMKMLESGASEPFFQLLYKYRFLEFLFPMCQRHIQNDTGSIFFDYLHTIDHMIQNGYKNFFNRTTLLSAMLFPFVEHEVLDATRKEKQPLRMAHVLHLLDTSFHEFAQTSFPHFPKRILSEAGAILIHQFRFTPLRGSPKFSLRFPSHEEFRSALSILSLRASIDHELKPLWHAWEKEYESRLEERRVHPSEKQTHLPSHHLETRHKRRRHYFKQR